MSVNILAFVQKYQCKKRLQRNKCLKDLVLFALNPGMREAEAFRLKKIDVHLKEQYVEATNTKTIYNSM